MKNLYFVQINNVYGDEKKSTYIPYAAGCIEAYCLESEIIRREYHFNKITYRRVDTEEFVAGLDEPFMVLFSCYVWNAEHNRRLAAAVKAAYPDCYITFGGHSSGAGDSDLRKYGFIDFVPHNYGEEPVARLLEALALGNDPGTVANLSYRAPDGGIHTTQAAVQRCEDYPSPYLAGIFDDILDDDIEFSALLETNRGCPNSCAYCDWGVLKSRVQLFPMERVRADIQWIVDHKIEYVYCVDANFCLFDRDVEIADLVVDCKEKSGYPRAFRVFFTKNRTDLVFSVGRKLYEHGLDKAQTVSFQSMSETVLKNIGRKNIPLSRFRDLMKRYNEAGLAVYSELILGLPGETFDSFTDGVADLIENGQHYAINIYPCELLPNSAMGDPEYIKEFGIKTRRVPFRVIHSSASGNTDSVAEYSDYVVSTNSLSERDWVRALVFSDYVQALHNLGLTRALAIYYRYEKQVSYKDFYLDIIGASRGSDGVLGEVCGRIDALCRGILAGKNEFVATFELTGDILWGFDELIFLELYRRLDDFYEELKARLINAHGCFPELDALFDYQRSIIKKIGPSVTEISSDHDFFGYFRRIYSNDYAPLERKPMTLRITDPEPVSDFPQFAREVVWFGRNKRATDLTSTHYIT